MSDKATWWQVTGFGDDIAILEDVSGYPSWVANVYGGREICPDTKREHFQGAVQVQGQQRFSKMKSWLPKSHIEAARKNIKTGKINTNALVNYAMKEETSAGQKICRENPKKYLDAAAICQLIRSKVKTARQTDSPKIIALQFWDAVCELIVEDPSLTGQLMNPSLRNFYCNTARAWDKINGRDSITHVHSVEHSETEWRQLPGVWPCRYGADTDDCCPYHDENNHKDQCIRCEKCEPYVYNGAETSDEEAQSSAASEASSEEGFKGPGAPPRRTQGPR